MNGGRGVPLLTRNLGQLSWQEVAFWQNEETSLFCAAKGILRSATAATGWKGGEEGRGEQEPQSQNLRQEAFSRRGLQCTDKNKYKYRYQLTKTQNIGGGAVTSLSESQTGAFFQTQFSFSSSRRNSPSSPSPPHFLDTVLLLLQCTDLGQGHNSSQRRHYRKINSEQ